MANPNSPLNGQSRVLDLGRGKAALLLPRHGPFSVVQSAHNNSGIVGANFDVILPAPPG